MKLSVVGLGLMGGSFALSIKKIYPSWQIVGYDLSRVHQKEALELNIIDKIADNFDEIKKSDIIVLATPVEAIIKTLNLLKDISKNTTVIDLGSTKEKIVKKTPNEIRKNLVAAHPMAGTENTGPKAAFDSLYQDKVVVFCDFEDSGKLQQKISKDIFIKLGMRIVFMKADEHDFHAAYISHLPHAISFALANSVLKQEDPKSILALAGGGFKDMSRIAKSSPIMWSDIFKQNQKNLLITLDSFQKELDLIKKFTKEERWEELKKWMGKANSLHNII
jgi:prephenate dehydrogenase